MSKYKTTADFIRICKDFANSEETAPLAKNIGLPGKVLTHSKSKLKKVASFIGYLDANNHKFSQRSQPFLTTTLHGHIARDFRSIMILIMREQNYQANIVTRHLIETFVMTLWGDLAAGFRDAFDYIGKFFSWVFGIDNEGHFTRSRISARCNCSVFEQIHSFLSVGQSLKTLHYFDSNDYGTLG